MNHTHYNVKMRAEKDRRHISGAERIVPCGDVQEAVRDLTRRAMCHPNGEPDSLSVTVHRIARDILMIPALPVSGPKGGNPEEARNILQRELALLGVDHRGILREFYALRGMRGAALLHERTLERMEPDPQRGIRATSMDYTGNQGGAKNHMKEALCLASKVAGCPYITAELCMSDDPDYTTGYFASRERGYIRLGGIKEKGDPRGGRIFLFRGSREDVGECMRYLEDTPVIVTME